MKDFPPCSNLKFVGWLLAAAVRIAKAGYAQPANPCRILMSFTPHEMQILCEQHGDQ